MQLPPIRGDKYQLFIKGLLLIDNLLIVILYQNVLLSCELHEIIDIIGPHSIVRIALIYFIRPYSDRGICLLLILGLGKVHLRGV
jgi:hypothetical protein